MINKRRIRLAGGGPIVPGSGPAKSNRSLNRGLVFILGLVSFLVYANTFNNDYAYDDFSVIKKNVIVSKGIATIPEILTTPYRYGYYATSNDLYRPLSLVMFAVEYQLSNGAPAAGHFVNVLFFAGCVILLFLFLDSLFEYKKTVVAFIASLLFAVHPIHTEVVANIKGRDELLCFFFSILSVNTFMRYVQQGKIKSLVTASFFFFLSLLSKETAISFLGVVPFIFFFYKNENKRRSVYISISCVMVALVFLAIRFSVLNAYHANNALAINFIDNALEKAPSAASRLATAILILGKYLMLLIIPYPLICDYAYNSIPFVNFTNIWALLSVVVYSSLIVVGVWRLIKFPKDPFAFGILFFLLTIALFSNILFLIGAAMAERFMFFASAGFCLVAALLVEKWINQSGTVADIVMLRSKKMLAIIIPLSIVFGLIAIDRNSEWADSLTLYKADVRKAPDNARLYFYLGNELLINGDSGDKDPAAKIQNADEAISILNKSLEIYPDYGDAHRAMGNGYFFLSRFDSAALHFKRAIALNPNDMEARNNLDVVYYSTARYQQSIEVCQGIIEIDTNNTERYNNIGVCYLHLGKYDSAVYVLKKGILKLPGFNSFYENLALAYKLSNEKDSAKKYEIISQKSNPAFRIY